MEWWRADKQKKAKVLADDISALANLARGAKFEIVAYMLELAAKEAAKEAVEQGSA
jgi:hypothetical protein